MELTSPLLSGEKVSLAGGGAVGRRVGPGRACGGGRVGVFCRAPAALGESAQLGRALATALAARAAPAPPHGRACRAPRDAASPPSQPTLNPLATVVVVVDLAKPSDDARIGRPAPSRAHAFGLDAFAAAVAHAAAFWGLYTLAAAFDSVSGRIGGRVGRPRAIAFPSCPASTPDLLFPQPLTTLVAALTYHVAAAATAASLLAATADATGPAPARPLAPVAVAGALFCVTAGACSFLFCWAAVVATHGWW